MSATLLTIAPCPVRAGAGRVSFGPPRRRTRVDWAPTFATVIRRSRTALARRVIHGIHNRGRHRYCCHLTEGLHAEPARLFWAAARATSAALMPSSARL